MIGLVLAALAGFILGVVVADITISRDFDDHCDDALDVIGDD